MLKRQASGLSPQYFVLAPHSVDRATIAPWSAEKPRAPGVTTDYLLRDTIPLEAAPTAIDTPSASAPEHANQFGTKLRALRQQHSWGQTELARQLGLARRGYISNLEAGRKMPSLELVVTIADLFGVTTDTLLRDELSLPSQGKT
jgi:DNA-binding XRE family transcriptional regulator